MYARVRNGNGRVSQSRYAGLEKMLAEKERQMQKLQIYELNIRKSLVTICNLLVRRWGKLLPSLSRIKRARVKNEEDKESKMETGGKEKGPQG
ncbi:hypothetical protein PUN28_003434 [Cardiocondyla obscurior]|uniref:Uncharacterized protein n=1 Tax=Cardiocondyla obscurior TaxID=286306 RepID=A0AAW2GJN4_9HYME